MADEDQEPGARLPRAQDDETASGPLGAVDARRQHARLKAFLDDLALVSLRHGLELDVDLQNEIIIARPLPDTFAGYSSMGAGANGTAGIWATDQDDLRMPLRSVNSLDVSDLSNHQKLDASRRLTASLQRPEPGVADEADQDFAEAFLKLKGSVPSDLPLGLDDEDPSH